MKTFLIFCFSVLCSFLLKAQETTDSTTFQSDTVVVKQKKSFFRKGHDPAKAALMAAILPGAGQIYNKKYWKLPIVYTGFAGLGALVTYSAVEFNGYNNALKLHFDNDSTTTGSYRGITNESQLKVRRKNFKEILDISAVSLAAWYLLQIVDATVDAHLIDFKVNDDISISLVPDFNYQANRGFAFQNNMYVGMRLRLNIK